MTLTTHAVVGAALASIIPANLVAGAALAFTSHFLLDAIPHWDYPMSSGFVNPQISSAFSLNKHLLLDAARIGTDGLLGLILPVLFFSNLTSTNIWIILMGAICAMLPDALQFVYAKIKREPLVSLQKFHMWIHAETKLDKKPLIGVPFQIILICLVAIALPHIIK